jgi:hypothetical protein
MKWSKTIAQGFSPGYDIPPSSALKGPETEARSVL